MWLNLSASRHRQQKGSYPRSKCRAPFLIHLGDFNCTFWVPLKVSFLGGLMFNGETNNCREPIPILARGSRARNQRKSHSFRLSFGRIANSGRFCAQNEPRSTQVPSSSSIACLAFPRFRVSAFPRSSRVARGAASPSGSGCQPHGVEAAPGPY